jgi:hypothetical protein
MPRLANSRLEPAGLRAIGRLGRAAQAGGLPLPINAAGFNDGDSAAATKRFSEAVTVERLARSSVG